MEIPQVARLNEFNRVVTNQILPRWSVLMILIFSLTIIDFNASFAKNPKLQYLTVVITLSFMLLSSFRKNYLSRLWLASLFSGILWFVGMSGVYWGKIVEFQTDGALPLIWPLAILMFAPFASEDSVDIAKGMVLIGHLSNFVTFECLLARLFAPSSLYNFSHEKGFLVFFSIFIGLKFKKRLITSISVILLILNFLSYPALTYVICGMSAFVINYSLKGKFRGIRFLTVQFLALFSLYYSSFQISQPLPFLDSAYTLLNRDNNVTYRDFLIRQVTSQISEQPFFGSLFRRSVLIGTQSGGLPVHNDFITITLGGGIFCLFLYLGMYVITNYRIWQTTGLIIDSTKRDALICFAVLINSYFFCSTANPISMKPQNGMILMGAIYCVKVIISSVETRRILP